MTLRWKFSGVLLLLYVMVLKTISLGCGVRASLMLFLNFWNQTARFLTFLWSADTSSLHCIYVLSFTSTEGTMLIPSLEPTELSFSHPIFKGVYSEFSVKWIMRIAKKVLSVACFMFQNFHQTKSFFRAVAPSYLWAHDVSMTMTNVYPTVQTLKWSVLPLNFS